MTRTTKKTQQNDVRLCLQQRPVRLMGTGNLNSELSLERREQPAKIRKEHEKQGQNQCNGLEAKMDLPHSQNR